MSSSFWGSQKSRLRRIEIVECSFQWYFGKGEVFAFIHFFASMCVEMSKLRECHTDDWKIPGSILDFSIGTFFWKREKSIEKNGPK